MSEDPLRLGLAAWRAGLIDAPQLARLAHAAGAGVDLAARLTALVGAEAVQALIAGQGTLDLGARLPPGAPAEPVAVADTQVGGPAAGGELASMFALGLDPDVFTARYALGDELGRGGVGVVVCAEDRLMGRVVAIKTLHAHGDGLGTARFVTEARTTAQLDHPNIVPVHDFGQLGDGRPCFTMRRVRGRSLEAVLAEVKAGAPTALSRYRLLQILEQVCMAVDYAHSKGVVHRDLKPANIMVGDFGEVLVMDWGIAKVAGQSLVDERGERPVSLDERGSSSTLQGSIVGTPGYMPPEQARGDTDQVDARSDVWALGALLYELLSGHRPFEARTALAVLMQTLQDTVVPPSQRAPDRAVPPDLEEICLRALAPQPGDRYPSARALHDELARFSAGTREAERRRQDAEALVADGDESLWYVEMLASERDERAEALAALPPLAAQAPLADKRARWALEDRVSALRDELDRAFDFAHGKFERALERQPDNAAARARLSDLHWRRYRQAREAHDHAGADAHLKAVGRFADPRYTARLKGEVPLTVRTQPPGATVRLARLVSQDRVLVPTAARVLGQTPLVDAAVPVGRQIVTLERPGQRPVSLPLRVWPGDELVFDLPLPSDAALGDDFVYVPAGTFERGNDPDAVLASPAGRPWLDGFAIQRRPVTVAEYFAFLDALPPEEAARHQPREPRVGPLFAPPPDGRWRAPMVDRDGDAWPGDWAICSVSYLDAEAYAAWRSLRDGVRYRLPTEDEWEKAARGTDGRKYPWGEHFDPSFCSNRHSTPGNLLPKPVEAFPVDCSPYGVRDLAGGVREWTASWFEANQRVIRGGAFNLYAFLCRAASRWGAGPRTTQASVGFRLVKDGVG